MSIHGVTSFLWFDNEAHEAAEFYVSLFPDSRITFESHYGEGAPKPAGSVLVTQFELFGRPFAALNGGPQFPHSEAVSFQVSCDTQEEIDALWAALIADGGEEGMCGWCKDRFGVSWQVTPTRLGAFLGAAGEAGQRAMAAMLQLRKFDISALEQAVSVE
jgi:predicted 3-demethylubiquinone-9 3-methyltransferase (glyoxalase superfamily)